MSDDKIEAIDSEKHDGMLKEAYPEHVEPIKAENYDEEPSFENHQEDMEGSFVIKQILQHLATKHGIHLEEFNVKEEKRCPNCHMTIKDIAYKGKFGCAQCYTTFKEDIVDIVRRVQGGQFEHVGKTPVSSTHKIALKKLIESKNKYLQQLVDKQLFEEAAVVRDEIKALQAESEG